LRTAVDTNVFIALFSGDDGQSGAAQEALEPTAEASALTVSAVVHAELLAGNRSPETVDEFFSSKGIEVHWDLGEELWRAAGTRYGHYAHARRRQSGDAGHRRILADFLVGSHALYMGGRRLMTTDTGLFSTYFSELEVISPENL
jgi:predicted nucleic acid-binding protein